MDLTKSTSSLPGGSAGTPKRNSFILWTLVLRSFSRWEIHTKPDAPAHKDWNKIMRVQLEAASTMNNLIECFGLPEAADQRYEEWFGYYHFEGDMLFVAFDPLTDTWDIKRNNNEKHQQLAPIWGKDETSNAAEHMSLLAMTSPPPLPADVSEATRSQPFVNNGWLFQWFYFPELKRWELAPIGRR